MLSERHVDKLLIRFPFLFPAGQAADASGRSPVVDEVATRRLVEAMVRLLSGLFMAEVLCRGLSDDKIVQFLDNELDEPTLDKWVEFQRTLLDERRVPFEEVFSLDYKRRDLLQLLNKRYLDHLELLQTQFADSAIEVDDSRSLYDEFTEFLLTYFKSEVIQRSTDAGESLRLVNRDREQGFSLHPIIRGSMADLEVFTGMTADGLLFHSLPHNERREVNEPALLEEFAEAFLKVGAYGRAIAVFDRLTRAGAITAEHPGAIYAGHCRLGLECYRRGKYHQAILEFDKAMHVRADLQALHYHLALAYARLSNYNRAIQLLVRLVEENPALDRGFELLGDLFQMKADPAAARRMYDKAYLANPYNRAVERKRRKLTDDRAARPAAAPTGDAKSGARAVATTAAEPADKGVHNLLIDLTKQAEAGELHPIVGREDELRQIVEILCCQMRSNPLVIGEPGVGKTALIEELANRLVRGQVPRALRGRKLYMMSVASLLAGAKFRGQFEERVLQLIQTLKSEPCVLFIDDIHTIVNSGLSKGGTLDTSSILKPALIRGEIQAIGSTTYDEYRLNIEKDPSLARSFQTVEIDEPTPEMMHDILTLHIERLSMHHGVTFADLDLVEISRMIKICLRERRLPDIAINMLDRAAARVCLRRAAASPDPIETDLPSVGREEVAEVISEVSGVPMTRLSEDQTRRFLHMEASLADRVVGQDEAVRAVARVTRTSKMNLDLHSHRPDGVFLFVGPSGVGKTELARTLAEFLFGDQDKLIRIDMSEYMEKISSSRLIGAAPGYVGYNDQNQFTDQVRKSPYSVILLDEIEKADSQMLNLFLQVFDAGRLTDGKGRTVHFDNTTIIMTSNVGTQLYSQARAGFGEGQGGRPVSTSELMKEVKRYFPPEFLNRIDEVVFFRQLELEDLKPIAALLLRDLTARLRKQGTDFVVADEVYLLLARESYSPEFGARNLARTIRRRVLDPLAELALHSPWERASQVLVTARDEAIQVTLKVSGEVLEPVELADAGAPEVEAVE